MPTRQASVRNFKALRDVLGEKAASILEIEKDQSQKPETGEERGKREQGALREQGLLLHLHG